MTIRASALALSFGMVFSSGAARPAAAPNPVRGGSLPVVSPKGDRIAFVSNRTGADDLYVISAKGKGETRLTQSPEAETGVQWSADSREIVYSTTEDDASRIYAIDPKGKAKREIGGVPGRSPMLAPDGKRAVFMAGTWTATKLTVSGLDGSDAREITDGSSIAWNNHWSPDGKRIAFTGRNEPDGELAVFVMNADGSGRRQVTHIAPEEGGAQWPAWSPDGRSLAVQVNSRAHKGVAHIWVVDVASGQARKLAPHEGTYLDETPSWFPDGKRIAFQSDRSGRMEVWVMKADGTDARQITGAD